MADLVSASLPVDVANVEYFSKGAVNLGVGTHELRFNARLPQVGAHGEIGDAGNHGDSGGDVVEETVCTRLGEGEAHEGDGRDNHHSADGLATINLRSLDFIEVDLSAYPVPI